MQHLSFIIRIHCFFLYIPILRAATLKSNDSYYATVAYYNRLMASNGNKISELNLFITAMPKGGDLHHHYTGSLYAETYFNWVARKNYCIYSADNSALNIQKYRIETNVSGLSTEASALCWSVDKIYSNNALYREILKYWSDIDYANHYHEQPPPDRQFFDTFNYFSPITDMNFTEGLTWIKATAINENLQYIETMLKSGPALSVDNGLNTLVNSLSSSSNDSEIDRVLTIYYNAVINDTKVASVISNYLQTLENAVSGINDANFTLRFQSYANRGNRPSQFFASLFSAFSAATLSNLIVGVNILGPENSIVSLRDYTLHMKMFRFLKQRFPTTKLAMHAGELTLSLVPPESLQSHIREAIEIAGANRIGHGVDILYERNSYGILEKMKLLSIPVEISISSNAFILGVKNEAHPLTLYRAYGIPFVISTDDAGVSRSSMSNEYFMFSNHYKPSYSELKQVVYNGIKYSFLNDSERQAQLNQLDVRFSNFEDTIAGIAGKFSGSNSIWLRSGLERFMASMILFCCLTFLFIEHQH